MRARAKERDLSIFFGFHLKIAKRFSTKDHVRETIELSILPLMEGLTIHNSAESNRPALAYPFSLCAYILGVSILPHYSQITAVVTVSRC